MTHPFHPQRGQRFVLTTRRQNWGEDRVMYYNAKGRLCSILASWTSVPEMDFFAQASAGRSWFRTDDLLQLCALFRSLRETYGDK
ncbi:transposase [Acidithiobacillus ferridurans]|nr:transposase [Acidithiobacillus ferridurans]